MRQTRETVRIVADTFLSKGYIDGDIIPHAVFWDLFGIEKPDGNGWSVAEIRRLDLLFSGCMERLKIELLNRGYDLQNKWSVGYYLVPYQDRPKKLSDDSLKEVKKAIRCGLRRAQSIHHPEQLTGEAKRILDATVQRLGYLKLIANNRLESSE